MKLIALLSMIVSLSAFAAGKYSDESFVICDVEISKWSEVKKLGQLDIAPDSKDPFIHCARPSQLFDVMNKYFKGTTQVILVTHASKVASILKYENNYPHLYGSLSLKDVLFSMVKAPETNGSYTLPEEFLANDLVLGCQLVRNDWCAGNVRWNCSEAYSVECKGTTQRSYLKADAEALRKRL